MNQEEGQRHNTQTKCSESLGWKNNRQSKSVCPDLSNEITRMEDDKEFDKLGLKE